MSVARLTGVENIFEGRVVSKDREAGTMTVEVLDEEGVCRLDLPYSNKASGEQVKIAIRPGDILLATEEPRHTSARNVLRGRVRSIEHRSDRTVVRVISGTGWTVNITRQAIKDLGLSADREVWLAIKTFSCYLLD